MKKLLSVILTILMIVTSMPFVLAAEHSHDDISDFTAFPAGTTQIETECSYYLTQDLELTSTLFINVEGTVNICLNGYGITFNGIGGNPAIVLLKGELNIYDCGTTGVIKRTDAAAAVVSIVDGDMNLYGGEISGGFYGVSPGGNFNMYGGKITGNKCGVYIGGSFVMYGGEISGNSNDREGSAVTVYAGSFIMHGGEIKNNGNTDSIWNSGAVAVYSGAFFTMKGGKISGNTANQGSAVYVGGSFVMDGGEISDNTVVTAAVSVGANAVFTMNDGKISDNTSVYGGGVWLNQQGTFNMNGGEISGNTANQGGGVYTTYNTAVINLKKGLITNNTATECAGGIGSLYNNTTIEISGDGVQIFNNTAPSYPDIKHFYPLVVSAPLDSETTKLCMTAYNDVIARPDGVKLTSLQGMEECFILDDEDLFVVCNKDGELEARFWEAEIKTTGGDLVVTTIADGSVTYQWYEVSGEDFTELEGETSYKITSDKLTVGKTYACRVYISGKEIDLLEIEYNYAITHQPTAEEPYVELNDDTDAAYQWYTDESIAVEITDENADGSWSTFGAPSEIYGIYDAATGWSSSTGYYFVKQLEAGDTVTFAFAEEGVNLFYMYSDTPGNIEMFEAVAANGTQADFIADADGYYGFLDYDNSSISIKAYTVDESYTEVEGETSAELDNPEMGTSYACEVTFADGTTEMSETFEYKYEITHQPTAEEPYVELNDDTDAAYQWYTFEDKNVELTDENCDTVSYDWGESSYDEETGWTGIPYEEDYYGQDFFTVSLEEGESITVEITGDFVDGVGIWDYNNGNDDWKDYEEGVTTYELTASEDGDYTFYTYVNSGVVTVRAYKEGTVYTEIEGETSAELKNAEKGTSYVCEVTFADGTTEMSDTFEAEDIHTCDFSGEWKYDENKHWKECDCGLIGEEDAHSIVNGVCSVCGYNCPDEDTSDEDTSDEDTSDENDDNSDIEIDGICPDCGRPAHGNSFIENLVCIIVVLYNFVVSLFYW